MKILLVNNTSNENHIGSKAVIENIYKLCEKNNFQIEWTLARHEIANNNESLQNILKDKIKKSEFIIINGEGSLHDSPSWFEKFLSLIPKNKKCILINSLWQNTTSEYLDKLDLISVRESYSYLDLSYNSEYNPSKIIITPDIIFYSKLKDSKIGYGDSVYPSMKMTLSKCDNYYPLQFSNNLPSLLAYKNWLNSLELYITGRFHGVCLASMSNTPFLSIPSNSHKIEGILEDMNCSELLIPNFINFKKHFEIAKKSIKKAYIYAQEAKPKIEKLFKRIKQI